MSTAEDHVALARTCTHLRRTAQNADGERLKPRNNTVVAYVLARMFVSAETR